MKRAIPVVLILLICGGAAAYLLTQSDDDSGQKIAAKSKQSKNSKNSKGKGDDNDGDVNVKTGSVNASYSDTEEINAAVSAEYGDQSNVTDIEVKGNSATATLASGEQIPLQLENGEWVPDVSAANVSTPNVSTPEADVPQASAPNVSAPDVQAPSTPSTPSP